MSTIDEDGDEAAVITFNTKLYTAFLVEHGSFLLSLLSPHQPSFGSEENPRSGVKHACGSVRHVHQDSKSPVRVLPQSKRA